jgi:hypothetical protein
VSETDQAEEASTTQPVLEDPQATPSTDEIQPGDPGPPEMEYFEKGKKASNG